MLYYVRVIETSQYFDLALNFFKYALLTDFALVQNFDSNLVLSNLVDRHYRIGVNGY